MVKLKKLFLSLAVFIVFCGQKSLATYTKIDYQSLTTNDKKYFFDEYNKIKYRSFLNLQIENFNILSIANDKKEGEIFLDVLENDVDYWNTKYAVYLRLNKGFEDVTNLLSIYRKDIVNEVLLEYGPKISHSIYLSKDFKYNKVDIGGTFKTRISYYRLDAKMIQNFSYLVLDFKKYNIKKELYNLNGILSLEANVGNDFKFLPSISIGYIYNFKNSFIDQNASKIVLNQGFDFLVSLASKLEYNYVGKVKLKLGVGYNFSKIFYMKYPYTIFDKNLINDKKNEYIHLLTAYLHLVIKDKHRIKTSFSYANDYILSASYSINF